MLGIPVSPAIRELASSGQEAFQCNERARGHAGRIKGRYRPNRYARLTIPLKCREESSARVAEQACPGAFQCAAVSVRSTALDTQDIARTNFKAEDVLKFGLPVPSCYSKLRQLL